MHELRFTKKRIEIMEQEQINYPWDWAPDWAEYAAIDQNGYAFLFGYKPFLAIEKWQPNARWVGRFVRVTDWTPPEDFDWKKSLQKRPNT